MESYFHWLECKLERERQNNIQKEKKINQLEKKNTAIIEMSTQKKLPSKKLLKILFFQIQRGKHTKHTNHNLLIIVKSTSVIG
jgi:hypothetical protein